LARKNRKKHSSQRIRNRDGVILILFVFIMMVTVGFAALTIDSQRWMSELHTLGNVGDNMSLSALDCYYNDPVLDGLFEQFSLNGLQRSEARMISGLRCAQNVFENSDTDMFFEKAKLWDPFVSFDWVQDYDRLINDLQANAPHHFKKQVYVSGAVHFLDINGIDIMDPRNSEAFENTRLVFRSEVQFEHDLAKGGIQPFFSDKAFYTTTTASAEVDNVGLTRSIVLVMDRSFSMCQSNISGVGSVITNRHAGQFDSVVCKPMQLLLEAAKVIPEILDEGNQFRDSNFNNSFGIVMFDVVAEAVQFDGGDPDKDTDLHLSHDEEENGYQEVIDLLNQTIWGTEVPRIGNYGDPHANPPTSDFLKEYAQNPGDPCYQESTSGCDPRTDPTCRENPDPCHHDRFFILDTFKSHWRKNLIANNPLTPSNQCEDLLRIRDEMPTPDACNEDKYLDTFSPWTQTSGDVGLQVAIELIRAERERLRQAFGDQFVKERFSGEIIYLSDVHFNVFSDRNATTAGADSFPTIHTDSGPFSCDELGITDSGSTRDDVIYPASWRKFVTQPFNRGDFYHNGTEMWTVDNQAYDVDNPPTGFEPNGIETNQNKAHADIHLHVDSASCPGPDCVGNVTSCLAHPQLAPKPWCRQRGKLAVTYNGRTIPSDTKIGCADLAVMDYALWAEANEITIHGLGFELPPASSTGGRLEQRIERLYLLDFMRDPSIDGRDVGLVFTDVGCENSGCPEVERALLRIGRSIRVRLS